MARKVELRERVGGGFNHADSLLYLKTHISMVDGLLSNGKININILPDIAITGLRKLGIMHQLTGSVQYLGSAAVFVAGTSAPLSSFIKPSTKDELRGSMFHVSQSGQLSFSHISDTTGGVTTESTVCYYVLLGYEDGVLPSNTGFDIEAGDFLVYEGHEIYNEKQIFYFYIINNSYPVVTQSFNGVMLATDKAKLDNIASNANNYTHPTQSAIDVNATDNGINVIDRVQVNAAGHVTAVSTRDLTLATTTTPGPMAAADKVKLDGIANNANNYSLPTATGSVLGGIKIGTRLSITDGVVSADSQTEQNFTSVLKSKLDNIASNANNYSHPGGGANVALTLATNETINALTVNADGHVTAASKQTIRTGSTSQTGLLQLATGTELTTSLSTSKVTTPDAVKSMINFFGAAFTRYVDLAAANAASHPDGSFCLVTVS